MSTNILLFQAVIGFNFSSIQSLIMSNGYHYGIDVIKRIANNLKQFMTPKISLFITHENRFCFFIEDYQSKQALIDFYEQVAASLKDLLLVERITCGVGIVELKPTVYKEADRLLKDLHIASEKVINQLNDKVIDFLFFDDDMVYQIEREQTIMEELFSVVEENRHDKVFILFQPLMNLKTDRVASFEALARFKSDKLGVISPLEFIPLLEKSKLIVPIGEIITYKSLAFLKHVEEHGFQVTLSINISPIQLLSANFATRFLEMVHEADVDPSKIWIEITESVFTNNYQLVNKILGDIQALGIRVSIDDFGTGYSSLHRVLELNIKAIKIDRAFINGLELIPEDIAITKDIVSLGHKLNYVVVAEGIENATQANYLKSYECDLGQGYFFSRPLEEEKAILFLKKVNI